MSPVQVRIYVFFLLITLAPCAYAQQPKVVATFSILGDVLTRVGAQKIDLVVLVGPNGDVHAFEPTPKESVILAKADIIFENGLHLEHWLDDLYEASASKAKRVVLTQGIEPIFLPDKRQDAQDADPHAWLDVHNVMHMVELVRDSLAAMDAGNADYYRHNADVYLGELAALDQWVVDALNVIPQSRRKLVTGHDTLGYFAKRYGFELIGAFEPSATTEAQDPSAGQIAKLLDIIKSSGIRVVFAESNQPNRLIKALSDQAGVRVAPPLFTDALGPKGSQGDTYIKMIQYDVNVMTSFLNDKHLSERE